MQTPNKNGIKKHLVAVILFLTLYNLPFAADKLGAVFLNIPPGAKALGMGMAFTASFSDPTSVYYNPGALSLYDRFGFVIVNQGLPPGIGRFIEQGFLAASGGIFYHKVVSPEAPWLEDFTSDMRYVFSSYIIPLSNIGVVGISAIYLDIGTIDAIDQNSVFLGTYEPYDIAVGLSYGKSILRRLGLGMTVKYIYSFLCPSWVLDHMPDLGIEQIGEEAKAYALDIGAIYSIRGISMGGSLANFGAKIKYYPTDSTARLPMRIRGGLSIQPIVVLDSLHLSNNSKIFGLPMNQVINVVFNYDKSYDPINPDDIRTSIGWEFTFLRFVSYRRGSCSGFKGETATGFGFNLRNVEIDIGKYFGYNTYHVQLTFHSLETPSYFKNNKKLNSWLTLASASLAPGGGQFCKGEGIKASLFFIPSLYLGNYCVTSNSSGTKTLSYIGLGLLYITSALEAMLSK